MPRLKNKGKLIKIHKFITTRIKTKGGKVKTIRKLNAYWVDPNKKSFKKMKKNVDYFMDQPINRYHWKDIRHRISTDKDYAMEAFLFLWEFQTDTEKNFGRTIFKNNVGFNKPDGIFVADFIRKIRNYGGFRNWEKTDPRSFQRAIDAVQAKMPKYSRQLADILNGNNRWRQFKLPKDVIAKKAKEFNLTSVSKPVEAKATKSKSLTPVPEAKPKRGKPSKKRRPLTTDGLISSIEKSSIYALQLVHMYRSIHGDPNIRPFYEQYLGKGVFKLTPTKQLQVDNWIREYAKTGKLSMQDRADIKTFAMRHAREIVGILNVNRLFGPGVTKLETSIDKMKTTVDVKKEQVNEYGIYKGEVVNVEKLIDFNELTKTKNFEKLIGDFVGISEREPNWHQKYMGGEWGNEEYTFTRLKSFIKHFIETGEGQSYMTLSKTGYPVSFTGFLKTTLDFLGYVSSTKKKNFDIFSGIDWTKKVKDKEPAIFYLAVANTMSKWGLTSDQQHVFGNTPVKDFVKIVDSLWDKDDPRSMITKLSYLYSNSSWVESIYDKDYHKKWSQMVTDLDLPHTAKLWDKYGKEENITDTQSVAIAKGLVDSKEFEDAFTYNAFRVFSPPAGRTDPSIEFEDAFTYNAFRNYVNNPLKKQIGALIDHDVVYRPDGFDGSTFAEHLKKLNPYLNRTYFHRLYFNSIKPKAQSDLLKRIGHNDDNIIDMLRISSHNIIGNWLNNSNKDNSLLIRRTARNILNISVSDDFDYVRNSIYNQNSNSLREEDVPELQVKEFKAIYETTQEYLNRQDAQIFFGIKDKNGEKVISHDIYRGNYLIDPQKHGPSVHGKWYIMGGVVSTTYDSGIPSIFSKADDNYLPIEETLDVWKKHGVDVRIKKNWQPYLTAIAHGDDPENGYKLKMKDIPVKNVIMLLDHDGMEHIRNKNLYFGHALGESELIILI